MIDAPTEMVASTTSYRYWGSVRAASMGENSTVWHKLRAYSTAVIAFFSTVSRSERIIPLM